MRIRAGSGISPISSYPVLPVPNEFQTHFHFLGYMLAVRFRFCRGGGDFRAGYCAFPAFRGASRSWILRSDGLGIRRDASFIRKAGFRRGGGLFRGYCRLCDAAETVPGDFRSESLLSAGAGPCGCVLLLLELDFAL